MFEIDSAYKSHTCSYKPINLPSGSDCRRHAFGSCKSVLVEKPLWFAPFLNGEISQDMNKSNATQNFYQRTLLGCCFVQLPPFKLGPKPLQPRPRVLRKFGSQNGRFHWPREELFFSLQDCPTVGIVFLKAYKKNTQNASQICIAREYSGESPVIC